MSGLRERALRFWYDRQLLTKALLAAGVPAAALTSAVLVFAIVQAAGASAKDRMADSHEASARVERVNSLLLDAGISVRTYLLTGDDSWLAPFHDSRLNLPVALDQLEELVSDDPAQSANAMRLRRLTAERIAALELLADEGPSHFQPPGPDQESLDLLEESRIAMGELRELITSMQASEARRLAETRSQADAVDRMGTLAVVILLAIGLVGGFAGATLLTVGIVRRVRLLEGAASDLAADRPVTWLPTGADEIGQLAASLGHASSLLAEREKSLADALAQAQDLYDNAPVGYHSLDSEGRLVRINATELRMLGFERQELLGRPMVELMTPASKRIFAELFPRLREGELVEGQELELLRKDGSALPVVVYATAVRDESGAFLHTRSIVEDATLRRQADRALHEKAALLDLVPDAIVATDPQGAITDWNTGAVRTYGYTVEEATGRQLPELLATTGPETPEAAERELHETGSWEGTLRQRHRDGRELVIASRQVLERSEDGSPGRILEVDRDVTDTQRTQRELESFFRLSRDLLVVADSETRFVRISTTWASALGEPASDLVGRSYLEFVHPDDVASTMAEAERLAREGLPTLHFENRYRFADGAYHWLEWTAQPDLEVGLVFAVARDISERRHFEEALDAARREAEAANRAKSEFLSRVSHELRTPLNAILGFAQLLELDGLRGPAHESVQQILRGGRHLLDLINEIIDISRIESGSLAASPEPVEVAELVADVVSLVGPVAAARGVRLRADVPEDSGHVLADRQRLKQVLLNLGTNAIKYGPPEGQVILSARRSEQGQVRFEVLDEGPGIPPEERHLLFAPFERLGAESRGVEGTGLGLALSKSLVEAMGGSIGVDDGPTRGSCFWLELPRSEDHSPAEAGSGQELLATEGSRSGPPTTSGTILCIEDNPSNLRLLERVLEMRQSIRLLPAMLGRLGLELAHEHHPDLVLLDLHLPDMAGVEVLARLRSDPATRDIPVVILSADVTPGRFERLLAGGARAFLPKPLVVADFLVLVDDLLGQHGGMPDAPARPGGAP